MIQLLANASCVAIDGRGVLIMGEPGSGKSSLALALIDRGATLVGDDGVSLTVEDMPTDGEADHPCPVIAGPPPNTEGMLEIRNVGIVHMPSCKAPLALALKLCKQAERLPERPDCLELLGREIPLLLLYPDSTALPLRAEWALHQYGIG